jgi:DnaK suppressor protein
MQKQKLDKFKKLISKNIAELCGKVYDLEIDEDGDEIDAAQCATIVDMAYDQRNRSNAKINRLHQALERIQDGTFGVCEECDSEIPSKRLEICLDTTLCIQCAELLEREKKAHK